MTNTLLKEPRIESGYDRLLCGINREYTPQNCLNIPSQWDEFKPFLNDSDKKIEGRVMNSNLAYGVSHGGDNSGNFEYLCAVEVHAGTPCPKGWTQLNLPQQTYAVFRHDEHISKITSTWQAIMSDWLPQSGFEKAMAPTMEIYDQNFDGTTGEGGLEIWLPVNER